MGARLTCKWEHLACDDIILGLAYLFAFAHYGTIFHTLSIGLGALTTVQSSSTLASAAEVGKTPQVPEGQSGLCCLAVLLHIEDPGLRHIVPQQAVHADVHPEYLYGRLSRRQDALHCRLRSSWGLRDSERAVELSRVRSRESLDQQGERGLQC